MSYILEALKKSDRARKRGEVPNLDDPLPSLPSSSSGHAMVRVWIAASVATVLLVGVTIAAIWVWRPAEKPQVLKPPVLKPQTKSVTQKPAPVAGPPRVKVKPTPALPTQIKQPKQQPLPALKKTKAYVARAWDSMGKGRYAQALNDLDRAIGLEPSNAEAWFARGWAHEKMGTEPTAMADYARAIDARPDYASALFSRGYLRLYHDDAAGAVVDFVRTQGVAKDQSLRNYSRLWLYISRLRAGQDAKTPLADDVRGADLTKWPGPLISYILGRTNETNVVNTIEAASKTATPTRKERRVTGYYFLAMFDLLSGKRNRAQTYFEKTLATGAVDFRQYDAAKRELNAMRTARESAQ